MSGLIDKSASFGMQNWFFVQKDTTGGTYDYYGFQDKKGAVLIMRTDKTFDNALYYLAAGVFSTVFAGKVGYTYTTPKDLSDPTI